MLFANMLLTSAVTNNTVATAINGVDLTSILQEVVNLLPITLPVLVGFLGIRKGISFLIGSLRRA